MRPKVTVIIPTKDNFSLVSNAVNQLGIKSSYDNFNFLIVDTGSSEETYAAERKWSRDSNWNIRVIQDTYGYCFPVNNNLGAKEADKDTEFFLFMNDDVEAVNDIISLCVDFMQNRENIGTVAPQLLRRDERIQGMGYVIEEYENSKLSLQKEASNQSDILFYSRDIKVAANNASCVLIRKDLFERVGGFPEIYVEDYSDVELGLKCVIEGYSNYCLGYAKAIHYGQQSRGKYDSMRALMHWDYKQNLMPFMELNKLTLRDKGVLRFKDRTLLQKDWSLGRSSSIDSNFENLDTDAIYRDPFEGNNMELQIDFEKRYGLKSEDGKLHVLMIGHKDGCGLARIDNPAHMINKKMQDIVAFPSTSLTPELINWASIIVWQVPVPDAMKPIRDFLLHYNIPQIFEIDDDYFHLDKFNLARSVIDPESVRDWLCNCTATTVTRESLGQYYSTFSKDFIYKVCPNSINFDKFPDTEYSTEDDVVRLGWMGGCTHYTDLEEVSEVIPELKKKYGDKLEIVLFGWDGKLKPPFFTPRNVFGDMTFTHINFVDVYKYYEKLCSLKLDACFIPLADIEFNRIGKSPLKYLEASAAKIPCVVSKSDVFNFVEDGKNALVAQNKEEWFEKLSKVIEDKKLRYELSKNGYTLIREQFNLEDTVKYWTDFYREIALTKYECVKS